MGVVSVNGLTVYICAFSKFGPLWIISTMDTLLFYFPQYLHWRYTYRTDLNNLPNLYSQLIDLDERCGHLCGGLRLPVEAVEQCNVWNCRCHSRAQGHYPAQTQEQSRKLNRIIVGYEGIDGGMDEWLRREYGQCVYP